ncbi:hypothetical protein MAR_026812 [Mya arenaria]|uniref:Uncharacterized protein n=1 Tax=Mya arenaria TaxID=6604 RepID=A0ABY7ETS6_MYAAR|nr:hypothetical protein MAR_026812 [Mya arenaria]
MEGAGEGQAISAEMLQSIQSAVGTGGVIGQVQVIETENGPMTVIFMEEGAEGVGETVGGTTLGMEGDIQQGEDVQYTYQVVDDNTFTTTGNLQDSTQQSILATETVTTTDTTFAHDPVVSLQNSTDNSQIAVSDAMQTIVSNPSQIVVSDNSQIATSDATQIVVTDPSQIAVGDTTQISVSDGTQINENDTYYITETGELVKIDSSLLTNADLQQQETYIQTSTDSFGNQQLILPEVSAVSSSIMQTPVIQSQTLIPETVQSQTIIPETVHSQTIIPDTAHSQTIIPETVYSQTLIPETVHSPSIIPGTTIMTSSQEDVLTAIKLSQNNYSAGASNAINTRPLTTFSKNKPFGSEKSLQTLRNPYVTLQTTIPTQTMVFPKANVKQPVINVRKSTPIARTPIAARTPETVNVRYQQTTGSGLFTYKTVKINPPGEQKTRLTVNTKPPLRTQSLISQSYLGTKKTEQKPQARTHVLSPATTIKYVSKPTSTVVKPVTPRPTMTQVRVQPPGYRTVPIKQSPQIMMKQSQQQELKSATDLLSSAIQEADMKLQEQRISPETTRIVLPTASVNQSRLPTSLLPSRAAGNVATSLIQPAVEAPMKPADQGDFSDSAMLTLVTQALDSGYLAVPSEPSKVSEITTSSTVVQSTVEAIPKDINQLLDEPPAVAVPVSEFLADNLAMDIDEQSAVQKTTELENEDAAHATKSGDKPASESEKRKASTKENDKGFSVRLVDQKEMKGTNIKDTLVVPPKDAQYYVMKEENDTDGNHSKEERKLKVKEETDPKIAREKGVNKHENIEESRVSEVKECLGNSDENHFKEIEDENVIQSVSLLGFPTELGCKPDTDEQYQLGYMLSIPEMCAPSSDQELLNNSIEEMLVETTESNIDNEVENHEVYIDNAEGRGIDTAQSESEVVTNEDTFKDDQGLENEFEDDIEQKPQIGSDSNEEFMAAVNVENPEGGIQAIYEEDMGREDLCTVEELKNGTRKIYKAPHENVLKNAVGQPKQLDLDVDIEGPFFEFRLPVPLLAENLKPLWRMYCCNLCENKKMSRKQRPRRRRFPWWWLRPPKRIYQLLWKQTSPQPPPLRHLPLSLAPVKLEDLGLNKEMLSGNTDIELLIVQGDGKEVRACINTSILENAEPSDNPESDSNNKQTATVMP